MPGAKGAAMIKRTERDQRTQEEKGPSAELGALVGPMLTGMATTRHDLLAWVHAHGLAALDELFGAEAVALAGPKGRPSTAAHPSSLGNGSDGAHLRRSACAGAPPPRAADDRRGSDVALGGGVSRSRSADRPDDAAAPRRGVDAPLRGQPRGAAERAAHPRQ